MVLFCGCFIALITTAYAFFSRMYLCGGQFSTDFGLDKVMVGNLQGAGSWPFGVSIILFNKDKTKWLNALHAGWPGGLVLGGLCTIALAGSRERLHSPARSQRRRGGMTVACEIMGAS